VLIFRGLAAVLPLAVGAVTVFGTFAVLRAVNLALPLSAPPPSPPGLVVIEIAVDRVMSLNN